MLPYDLEEKKAPNFYFFFNQRVDQKKGLVKRKGGGGDKNVQKGKAGSLLYLRLRRIKLKINVQFWQFTLN